MRNALTCLALAASATAAFGQTFDQALAGRLDAAEGAGNPGSATRWLKPGRQRAMPLRI
jgi:hypothetical protein